MRLGFYLPFAQTADIPASSVALRAVTAMRRKLLEGVTDIIPSYTNLYFEFDASLTTAEKVQAWANLYLNQTNESLTRSIVEIPVQYNGADLEFVSEKTGLTVAEIIRLHSSQTYHAFAVGFTPGFPFLGVLSAPLHLPRRATPRASVSAHAVGIAMGQTGVYPSASPGGWHLLGTAGVAMYDPNRDPAFWVQAGDTVRFVPTDTVQAPRLEPRRLLPALPRYPVLQLEEAGLLTLLVDTGRRLVGHLGLAQSGALDARSAARANAVVGNATNTALLELTLTGGVWTALQDVVLGFAGYGMNPVINGVVIPAASSFAVRRGQTLRFKPNSSGVRGYLAVAGGFESDGVWGSASSDHRGLLNGILQSGDLLGAANPRATRADFTLSQPTLESTARVRLLAAPQATLEALATLQSSSYRLERGDRMGLQLLGKPVQGGDIASQATPLGAIQISNAGQPIILLHDRGRIGGYSKPAIVYPNDLWRVAQVRTGGRIRFSKG